MGKHRVASSGGGRQRGVLAGGLATAGAAAGALVIDVAGGSVASFGIAVSVALTTFVVLLCRRPFVMLLVKSGSESGATTLVIGFAQRRDDVGPDTEPQQFQPTPPRPRN